MAELGTMRVKSGLAEMLKGGVIMDVVTAEQARIAEEAGAVAGVAAGRVPGGKRRGRRLRRLGDLQVGRPREAGARDRRGDDALPRPRDPGARLGRSRRADGR